MPTLQKSFSLSITPEQFINACSRTELIELELLLGSSRIQKIINSQSDSEKSDESDEFGLSRLLKKNKPPEPPQAPKGRIIGL